MCDQGKKKTFARNAFIAFMIAALSGCSISEPDCASDSTRKEIDRFARSKANNSVVVAIRSDHLAPSKSEQNKLALEFENTRMPSVIENDQYKSLRIQLDNDDYKLKNEVRRECFKKNYFLCCEPSFAQRAVSFKGLPELCERLNSTAKRMASLTDQWDEEQKLIMQNKKTQISERITFLIREENRAWDERIRLMKYELSQIRTTDKNAVTKNVSCAANLTGTIGDFGSKTIGLIYKIEKTAEGGYFYTITDF